MIRPEKCMMMANKGMIVKIKCITEAEKCMRGVEKSKTGVVNGILRKGKGKGKRQRGTKALSNTG